MYELFILVLINLKIVIGIINECMVELLIWVHLICFHSAMQQLELESDHKVIDRKNKNK
jgi:hypothetical protein